MTRVVYLRDHEDQDDDPDVVTRAVIEIVVALYKMKTNHPRQTKGSHV